MQHFSDRNRSLIAALTLSVIAVVYFAACETQAPYTTCELDVEVTSKGICAGDGKGSTSCVVTQHPHCQEAVCLSYYGQKPICSRTCTTKDDKDTQGTCDAGSFCWTFADATSLPGAATNTTASQKTEKYCVPSSALAK